MNTLSVVVLTYNNENIIVRFVKSVAWSYELVVVDSGSTDNTVVLAKANHPNCHVLTRPLDSFAAQRNFGLDAATGDWVMHCDSDEIVTNELRDEICLLLESNPRQFQVYNAVRRHYWFSQELKQDSGPNGFLGILHKRKIARFTGRIHEKLEFECPVGILNNMMIHVTDKTLNQLLAQYISYADKEVEAILAGERTIKGGGFNIFWRPVRRFIYSFVFKRAYRDGIPGIVWAVIIAFRSFLIQFKYWETQQHTWGDYEDRD